MTSGPVELVDPQEEKMNDLLAKMHLMTAEAGITIQDGIELHMRAMLGCAYEGTGEMGQALTRLETYVADVIKMLRAEGAPRIALVSGGKIIKPH